MFNTATQSFSSIPPPNTQLDGVGVSAQLLEMHGHLAVAIISPRRVDVWVRCNVTGLWSRLHRIVPPLEIVFTSSAFAVAREGNGPLQSPHIMLAENGIFFSGHTIQESLLLHPSILPFQDTDCGVGDPPIFRNQ
jgi:hypothetical protein